MTTARVGRNDLCPCGSGKKFKKCCLPKQSAEWTGPTGWAHPPGQPNAAPPPTGEWTDYYFVKGKGWTHKKDLKPGDQYKVKEGGWETVQPERIIRTTPEHRYYVQGKGWTEAGGLREGDLIRTEEGWVPVSKVEDTGKYETVYNVRVADYHTYFVGDEDWGFAVWSHNTYYEVKVSPTGLVQIFEGNQTTAVAKARGTGSLERAAYYLANLQSDEAGFNRVLADIRTAIGKSTNAAVRALTIRPAASENRNILVRGTAAWDAAAYAIGHTASGHMNDYRVASATDAQQLLWDAYDATSYGRLPLRRPGTDEWQAGRYEFGHHFDTDYEGDPRTNAYQNNLQHVKWRDWRRDGGHTPADGHIYYGTWTGPHQYTQPPQGW